MNRHGILMKDCPEDDKPREKMLHHGAASLTNSELLAVLLRSGTRDESVIDMSKRVLRECDDDIDKLALMNIHDFISRFKGIGPAKAASLVAALELGRRRGTGRKSMSRISIIRSSTDAFKYFLPSMSDLDHEEFWVLYLSHANRVISIDRMAVGGMDSMITDIRILFKKALERKAHFIIIAHNHPSGLLVPSSQDKMMTERIAKAGKIVDIRLYDHLIIGNGDYYSFADNGCVP